MANRIAEEASNYAQRANGAVDDLRRGAESAASTVSEAASRAGDTARHAARSAREQFGTAAEDLRAGAQQVAQRVSQQPLTAVAIAGAIGLLAGILLGRSR